MPRAALALIAAVLVAGCGNDRTAPPELERALDPDGKRTVVLKTSGIRFRAPGNWADLPPSGSRAGGIRSGRATVAVWRYPRREPLPASRAELRQVRELLLDRIDERDETFDLGRSRLVQRSGAPAIEVLGTQTIAGQKARVRSLHVYKGRAEVVVDAYSPAADFRRVDRAVFQPLLRSLRLREVK